MTGEHSGQAGTRFGYLVGSDSHGSVVLDRETGIRNAGSTDIYLLRTENPRDYTRIHVTKNYFRQSIREDLRPYRCLLNLVTDPDQNPKVLFAIGKMLKPFKGRVINRPEHVLDTTRDIVARQLGGIPEVHAPKTVRLKAPNPDVAKRAIERAALASPAILRLAGTHTGTIIGLFHGLEDMLPHLAGREDHIATEFVDFKSPDGLYRKYRFFFIGRRIIFRHMLVSDQWNVHAADRTRFMAPRADLLEEERRLFDGGVAGFPDVAQAGLAAIRRAIPLDYFGLDCGIDGDSRIVLFEANATMNFFPFLEDSRFDYVKTCLRPAQAAFDALLFDR